MALRYHLKKWANDTSSSAKSERAIEASVSCVGNTMARKVPLGVLISGSGTNLQAIIDAIEAKQLDAVLRLVLSNRADAYGLQRAKDHGIPTEVLDHKQFASREAFDAAVV